MRRTPAGVRKALPRGVIDENCRQVSAERLQLLVQFRRRKIVPVKGQTVPVPVVLLHACVALGFEQRIVRLGRQIFLAGTILGGLALVIIVGLAGGLILARRVLVRLDAMRGFK